jgi:hypothetical protein
MGGRGRVDRDDPGPVWTCGLHLPVRSHLLGDSTESGQPGWVHLGVTERSRARMPGDTPDTEATMHREKITLAKIREFIATSILAERLIDGLINLLHKLIVSLNC